MSRYFFLSLIITGLLSSCKMEQEYWINEDGGGEQTFTMDMSGMGSMAKMFEGAMDEESIDEDMLQENLKDELDPEVIEDIMEGTPDKDFSLTDIFSNPGSLGEVDTIMVMYDVMPDSLKTQPNAHLAKKMYMKIKSSESEDDMMMTFGMKYENKEEFEQVSAAFGEMLAKSEGKEASAPGQNPMDKMSSFFTYDYILDAKRGTMIIPEQDLSDEMSEGMGGEEMDMDFDDPQERAMFEMMFGGDTGYKLTYHLPGPVEFTSDMNAKIEGNKVTFMHSMMDLMEMQKLPKKVIKYKT